ncbi:hypothetical protein AB7942_26410 [Neobacillus sp. BF23-41]|uniref:hypothetical protein n=1 Tax=Neobacillus sp. BF23-41 TaxID=3240280 RepID=UPI0034E3E7C0
MKIKKVRGLKTKIRKFYKDFEEETKVFPTDFEEYFEFNKWVLRRLFFCSTNGAVSLKNRRKI